MKTGESNELFFSHKPKISLTDVRGWLDRLNRGDATVKPELISFIEHRLRGRYVVPLLQVPEKFKSGFLMMASACLLIESLQAFRKGKNESERGSEAAFIDFFDEHEKCFPGLRSSFPVVLKKNKKGETKEKCTFYKNIRCGILHQAETTGRYRLVRDESPLFDPVKRTVNADKFFERLQNSLSQYISNLREDGITSELWDAAATKVEYICDNFEYGKVVHFK